MYGIVRVGVSMSADKSIHEFREEIENSTSSFICAGYRLASENVIYNASNNSREALITFTHE